MDRTLPLGLNEDGGMYRWRDIFRLLGLAAMEVLLPRLGIPTSDEPGLLAEAQKIAEQLDVIHQTQADQPEDDYATFHSRSAAVIRQGLDDIEARLGPTVAQRVYELGMLSDTAPEFVWSVLLTNLCGSLAVTSDDLIRILGVDHTEAEELCELVRHEITGPSLDEIESLLTTGDRPVDDGVVSHASDLLRWASVRRVLARLHEDWRPSSIQLLTAWAQTESTRLGIDEDVSLI